MPIIKFNLALLLIILAVLLFSACRYNTEHIPQSDIINAVENTTEHVQKHLYDFKNYDDARAVITKLASQSYFSAYVDHNSFEQYKKTAAKALDYLKTADTEAVDYLSVSAELADELYYAADNVKYLRGDVPRVYINTYLETENYALSAKVRTSSEPDKDHPSEAAIDNNSKTYWFSDGNDYQLIELELSESRTIGYISLEWGKGAPKVYTVSYSKDGTNWIEAVHVDDCGRYKTKSTVINTPFTTSHIRIELLENVSAGSQYRLEEVVIAEKKATPPINITQNNYTEAQIAIVDREGGKYKTLEESITIEVRGNSTANTVKNPYNIRFESKQKILGIKGTRKWCLLANLFDKTLIRNKLAYDFAATAGVNPHIKSCFVELYLDGNYKGSYILTLPVTDGVLDLDIEAGDMLFERNGYYNTDLAGVNYNYTPIQGIRFVPISPEKGTETSNQKAFIKQLLADVELACISGQRKRIEDVIDVSSFVNMYICEELMKDIDIFHGSTYFYYKDGKFYSGPIWDMDLSMGNVSVSNGNVDDKYAKYSNLTINIVKHGNGNAGDSTTGIWAQVDFYGYLMKADWFKKLVCERYIELIPDIEKMYSDGGVIDSYVKEAGESFNRNYAEGGYSLYDKYFYCEHDNPAGNYSTEIKRLKEWLKKRDIWLREYLGNL